MASQSLKPGSAIPFFPDQFILACTCCRTPMKAPKKCKQLTCYKCMSVTSAVHYADLEGKIQRWRVRSELLRRRALELQKQRAATVGTPSSAGAGGTKRPRSPTSLALAPDARRNFVPATSVDSPVPKRSRSAGEEQVLASPSPLPRDLAHVVSSSGHMLVEDGALLDSCLKEVLDALRAGEDNRSKRCHYLYQKVLPLAFKKIMTEKAVQGWNSSTMKSVFTRAEQFLQFYAEKLQRNRVTEEPASWNGCFLSLTQVFEMCLDANNEFHRKNAGNPSYYDKLDSSVFAMPLKHTPPEPEFPGYIWLADMLDSFGVNRGFDSLRSTIVNSDEVTGAQMVALIRPFGGTVARMLSPQLIVDVFIPIRDRFIGHLDQLPDLTTYHCLLTDFSQQQCQQHALSALKSLELRGSLSAKKVDCSRLRMCMELVSCGSSDREMTGLDTIVRLVGEAKCVDDSKDQVTWLTRARLAEWMYANRILQKLLGTNPHREGYADQLVMIIDFLVSPKPCENLAGRLAQVQPPILDLIVSIDCNAADCYDKTVVAANIRKLLSHLVPELDLHGPAATDQLFQLLETGATDLQPHKYNRLLEVSKVVVGQLAQQTEASAWAKIESLPNYCSYSSMQTELVPSGDPTHALLAAEMQRTATRHRWSTSGATGPLQEPPKIQVLRIEKILNRRLQDSYLTELQNTIGLCRGKSPVDKMNDVEARRVQSYVGLQMNEFLLYHGADSSKIERLQRSGLDPRYAGTNRGKLFGIGTYLASNSSKSDLYTKPNAKGERCLLLVRAALGEPARLTSPSPHLLMPPEREDQRGPLSSVVGMTSPEGGRLQHREYVVYHTAHTLPQYAIWYKHSNGCGCTNCVRAQK